MARAVKQRETTELSTAADNANPFEAYGQMASSGSNIVGRLLKFSKGDWFAGQEEAEIKIGTRFVVDFDTFEIGWLRWEDNRPAESYTGLVKDRFVPPRRPELGYTEESEWDVDSYGRPRDPWQFTNAVRFKDSDKPGETENLYTFTTSSRGGIGAFAKVSAAFGQQMRQRPDENPIVEIGTDSYNHSVKEYGRIKVPTFEIVGWEEKDVWAGKAPAKKTRRR